jgi:short-subunit dehydrogenase
MQARKILITGARGGMGRDAALALADRGHEVFVGTETEPQAEAFKRETDRAGYDIRIERLNLLDGNDHRKAADFAPDVLINNAAIGESGPLAEIPMERLRHNFDTNVFGTIELTQTVLEGMLERGSGRIIIFSSVGGKLVIPYFGAYHMTKFALEAAADSFRGELDHHDISVSVIEPGAINTGFNERMNATKYQWFDENARFGADMDRVTKYEAALTRTQHPTDSVTRAVIHAVESTKPKTRYVRPLWPYAPMLWLATAIPSRLRDWVLRKMAGV